MDQFDAYFRRADLDRDGRISGAEAVSFFQGSGLSKQVLAQIWTHADQNRTGFLGRPEFYNALKLITVAQNKRDITPYIVKAALYGPASSKIPPPQINAPPAPGGFTAAPTPQVTNRGASPIVSSPLPNAHDMQLVPSHSIAQDPKASVSGNALASNLSFGGDLFSSLVPKQNSSSTASSAVVSSNLVPSSPQPQPSWIQGSVQPLQNAFTKQPTSSQLMQSQTLVNKPQQPQTAFNLSQAVSQATSTVVSPVNAAPWPKMTVAGIQKYTKHFIDVDTDRDGKITGEQARNLFLSWKLPRGITESSTEVWMADFPPCHIKL